MHDTSSDPAATVRRRPGRPTGGPDVKEAILSATLRQLDSSTDPDAVTVAAVVAEAGCSPPSLYHYWPKRELLLAEAATRGWQQFAAGQAGAVAEEHDPLHRIRLRGHAYLEFALTRPALFRVLFAEAAPPLTDEPPSLGDGLDGLVDDVRAALAAGQLRPVADALTTALALWAAVHGVASLWAVSPALPAELARTVAAVLQDAVLAGMAT